MRAAPPIVAAVDEIAERLRRRGRVRRPLPVWGRLHVDRPLPLLCVYRRPAGGEADPGAAAIAASQASYLLAPGDAESQQAVSELVARVAAAARDRFGGCLVLEVWPAAREEDTEESPTTPGFRIVSDGTPELRDAATTLRESLSQVRLEGADSEVRLVRDQPVCPPGVAPLLAGADDVSGLHVLGLEIRPVYIGPDGEVFPLLLRELRRQVAEALARTWHAFARSRTSLRPAHFHAFGRRSLTAAERDSDRGLAEVAARVNFLALVTPTNTEEAWEEFERDGFRSEPSFHYRPLHFWPPELKRRLFRLPVGRVEDPTLAHLLEEKQVELDEHLVMLQQRGTKTFLYQSLQLFGDVDDPLHDAALGLLRDLPREGGPSEEGRTLGVDELTRRAEAECRHYRQACPRFRAEVRRSDSLQGLMASEGHLVVGEGVHLSERRAEALLQHEVGVHLFTHYKAGAQRLRLLRTGLAGYEELQEGLAVLAEHLAGGLSAARLRLIAARVVAVRRVIEGATFAEAFDELTTGHGFAPRAAFTVCMRAFRGGGLTKDVIYLRGLVRLLEALRGGADLGVLFVGKFAAGHVPAVEELLRRGVLRPTPLRPRFLGLPGSAERLRRIHGGLPLAELASG